jgi:hypothetical protein
LGRNARGKHHISGHLRTMIKGNTCKDNISKGKACSGNAYTVNACHGQACKYNSYNDNAVRVMHVWAEMSGESIISQGI